MIVIKRWINGLNNDPMLYGPFADWETAEKWAEARFYEDELWGWEALEEPD